MQRKSRRRKQELVNSHYLSAFARASCFVSKKSDSMTSSPAVDSLIVLLSAYFSMYTLYDMTASVLQSRTSRPHSADSYKLKIFWRENFSSGIQIKILIMLNSKTSNISNVCNEAPKVPIWLKDIYPHIKNNLDIVRNGFRAVGITSILH